MRRSVTAEIDLEEAGEYSVLVKITAIRDYSSLPVETVIRDNCKNRRDKLLRIGLAYDLAHAKGQLEETADEKVLREKAEARQKAKELADTKAKMIEDKKKVKKSKKKHARREKAAADKAAKKQAKKAAKESQKMMVGHSADQNQKIDGNGQDNAAAAAGITRPGEPDNAKDPTFDDDCAECQAQRAQLAQASKPAASSQEAQQSESTDQTEKPADTDTSKDNNGDGNPAKDDFPGQLSKMVTFGDFKNNNVDGPDRQDDSSFGTSFSKSDTSSFRLTQEDPAKDDVPGELSRMVTFGDPQNNRMPCGFPESSRPSVDVGGSNYATGQNSPTSSRSRRASEQEGAQEADGAQRDDGTNSRKTSGGPPPGANADTSAMSSTTILDFVQPTYRPGVHGRRQTSLADVDRTAKGDAPEPAPVPAPQPQTQEDEDSETDSDVSSVCSSAVEETLTKSKAPPAPEPAKTEEQKNKEEEEETEFEKDPWNAVCVVGLRLYAKALVREEKDGEVHWHRDEGCGCGGMGQGDGDIPNVDKRVDELVKEIEAHVWTPTTDDEKELSESPEQTEQDKKESDGVERKDMAAETEKRKKKVTIKQPEEPVEVTIRVVRPNSWEDGEASLDVDDSAMDATKGDNCGEGKDGRKDSIMGIRGRLGSVIAKSNNT